MLESVYLTLLGISFVCLISAFFNKALLAKVALMGSATVIFGALAAASGEIEIISCTSTSCTSIVYSYFENMWFFLSFVILSTFSALSFAFMAVSEWKNPEKV